MTTIYFSGPGTSQLEAVRQWDWDERPLAVLVSFAYLNSWHQIRPYFRRPRALMLDSGAFTAHSSGRQVDIDALIRETKSDEWDEAVGLDVIGSWEGSKRNADYMKRAGASKAFPVFHIGEPWELLDYYAAGWDKVGLGGMVGARPLKTVLRWIEQCFARAWPKKLHSFGRCEDAVLQRFPFHSADAATWSVAPTAYRNWLFKKQGRYVQRHLSVEGRDMQTFGVLNHMEAMYRREQQLIARWAPTLASLEKGKSNDGPPPPQGLSPGPVE